MKRLVFFLILISAPLLANETVCKSYKALALVQDRQNELGYSDEQLNQWHKVKEPKSVAIVFHGLNMKPNKMKSIVSLLNESGSSVLNVTLEGHGNHFESFENVTQDKWLEDFHNAYCESELIAKKHSLPLYIFGYSTGATVAVAAELRNANYKFNKRLLMSPALVMTKMANMIRLLFPFEFMNIPSSNLNEYIAHKSTPIPAYKALFQLADEIKESTNSGKLNEAKTLVLMDPQDELVSFSGIRQLTSKHQLSNWSLYTVFTSEDRSKTRAPHHSIIDEFFTGPELWSEISERAKLFLKSGI